MQWAPLTNQLVEELSKSLNLKGFQWILDKSQFRNETSYGFTNFVLSFSNYDDGVMVEGHCGIQVRAVEEVVAPFLNGVRAQGVDSHTIICSTAKLNQQPMHRFLVHSKITANDAANEMFDTIAQHGDAFWSRYSQLEALDTLFNSSNEQVSRLVNNVPQALMRGLVVAKLIDRGDFEELVHNQRIRLEQAYTNPLLIQRFEELAVSLRGNWLH